MGCHDDCISSRRISYILYLSDEVWTHEDGGELELYAVNDFIPKKTIPPRFGTMVCFRVEAGVSLHSVQEVFSGTRRRISIQGWFHTDEEIENRSKATIADLTTKRVISVSSVQPTTTILSECVNAAYVRGNSEPMQTALRDANCLVLKDFINSSMFVNVASAARAVDGMDEIGGWKRPDYECGLSKEWTLTGPPHERRFCRLVDDGVVLDATGAASKLTKLQNAALQMQKIRRVFCSEAFREWLSALVGQRLMLVSSEARRFRAGLDYTVGTGGNGGFVLVNWSHVEEDGAWKKGDVGGHLICMHGDEDSSRAQEAAEVYEHNSNDNDLLSFAPSPNSLSVVLISKQEKSPLHFVQYVSAGAPGSRWDVETLFSVIQ